MERLLDVFALFASDMRVQVYFTIAPHPFNEGVSQLLARLAMPVLSWDEAVRREFDLALAAGSRGIEQIQAPLVRLPHGAGHTKLLRPAEATQRTSSRPAAMLSREYLTHGGRVIPAAIALAHHADRSALAESCPEALPMAYVVGDPAHDRIKASLPYRERYRVALGLREGEKLILAVSTWGRSASFGQFDALLPRLLSELPRDTHRAAIMVHPNVAAHHGWWQIRAWLSASCRRGIALVPPACDWRALLVAADGVIGDHGSVTTYATLTRAPVILARHPQHEVHPDSSAAALALTAPALSPAHSLEEQLRYARTEHRPEAYAAVAARISSEPGRFNRNTRALLYRLLGIGEPAYPPATEPVPVPDRRALWPQGGDDQGAVA